MKKKEIANICDKVELKIKNDKEFMLKWNQTAIDYTKDKITDGKDIESRTNEEYLLGMEEFMSVYHKVYCKRFIQEALCEIFCKDED